MVSYGPKRSHGNLISFFWHTFLSVLFCILFQRCPGPYLCISHCCDGHWRIDGRKWRQKVPFRGETSIVFLTLYKREETTKHQEGRGQHWLHQWNPIFINSLGCPRTHFLRLNHRTYGQPFYIRRCKIFWGLLWFSPFIWCLVFIENSSRIICQGCFRVHFEVYQSWCTSIYLHYLLILAHFSVYFDSISISFYPKKSSKLFSLSKSQLQIRFISTSSLIFGPFYVHFT